MKPNYRNLNINSQDLRIGKNFKIQLLRLNPQVELCTGYIPLWSWCRDHASPVGFERIEEKCFILPISGDNGLRKILSGIRSQKPPAIYQYLDKTGVVQALPIGELTEKDLLKVLRNLSWLVTETDNYRHAYRFDIDGQKFITLRTDQLALGTRFTRRKLSRLLADYIRGIIKNEEIDSDLQRQLLKEHRLNKSDLEAFSSAALALRSARGNPRKDLTDELNAKFKAFIIEKKNAPRKSGALEIKIVAATVGRHLKEIRAAVVEIAKLWALGYYIDEDKNNRAAEAIIKTLQKEYGLTKEQVYMVTKQSEYQLMYPSSPDLLSEMIKNITKGGCHE
jgi:hypothetical protein